MSLTIFMNPSFWSGSATEWLTAGGTVGATVVALAFSIPALRSARREQQARIEDRKRERKEAIRENAKVYCWAQARLYPYKNGGTAWIRNDTDMAIQSVGLVVYTKSYGVGKPFHLNTSVFVPPRQTIELPLEPSHFGDEVANPKMYAFINFTDVDGYNWTRHPSGALTSFPWPDGKLLEPEDMTTGRSADEEGADQFR